MIKSCLFCLKQYSAKREWQNYCSKLCRMRGFHKNHQITKTDCIFSEFEPQLNFIHIPSSIISQIKDFRICYGIYRNLTYLYIGSSIVGPSRLRRHEVITNIPYQPSDELHIWLKLFNPRELERSLIAHHQPTLNTIRPSRNLISIREPDLIFHLQSPE